jgi:hypothetical protein
MWDSQHITSLAIEGQLLGPAALLLEKMFRTQLVVAHWVSSLDMLMERGVTGGNKLRGNGKQRQCGVII